jgi:hypothetical protein
MKITVSVCRKIGMPNYSSEGATCSIETECDDAQALATARLAYATAEQLVSEQLNHHKVEQPQPQPAAAAAVAPARPPAAEEPPGRRNGNGKGSPNSQRQYGQGPHNGRPHCGRELYPWSKRLEESGECPKLSRRLSQYGDAEGFPKRMIDWSREQVNEAISEVVEKQYDEIVSN